LQRGHKGKRIARHGQIAPALPEQPDHGKFE